MHKNVIKYNIENLNTSKVNPINPIQKIFECI